MRGLPSHTATHLGPRLRLRLIDEGDACFVAALRGDKALNKYLSEAACSVAEQQAWIRAYKTRELSGQELYYVIERRDREHEPCGLVRLYRFTRENFTWGSWILAANKPQKAALESAVLSFAIGFYVLKKPLALIDVRSANEKAVRFYRRLGMMQTDTDAHNIFFEYRRQQFEEHYERFMSVIEEQS